MALFGFITAYVGHVDLVFLGIKKDCVPDMIKIKLTYAPIKSWIVYPDIDGFFYGP